MNAKYRARLINMAVALRSAREEIRNENERFICMALNSLPRLPGSRDAIRLIERALDGNYTLESWITVNQGETLGWDSYRQLRLQWIDRLVADIEKAAQS